MDIFAQVLTSSIALNCHLIDRNYEWEMWRNITLTNLIKTYIFLVIVLDKVFL